MTDLSITQAGALQRSNDMASLRQAADQFETYFLKEIMKNMPKGNTLFGDSSALEQYQQMLHDGLAERSAGSLGIADMLVEELASRASIRMPEGD